MSTLTILILISYFLAGVWSQPFNYDSVITTSIDYTNGTESCLPYDSLCNPGESICCPNLQCIPCGNLMEKSPTRCC